MDKERIAYAVKEILLGLGAPIDKEGFKATPERVARLYSEFFSYGKKIEVIRENEYDKKNGSYYITVFENKTQKPDSPILLRKCKIFSFCSHHLLPIVGDCWVAYIPDKWKLGLSKINKIVDYCSHKLIDQESLSDDIADTFMELIKPQGVMVYIKAIHFCGEIKHNNGEFTSSSLRGVFSSNQILESKVLEMMKIA